jgi:hypothetical protein
VVEIGDKRVGAGERGEGARIIHESREPLASKDGALAVLRTRLPARERLDDDVTPARRDAHREPSLTAAEDMQRPRALE